MSWIATAVIAVSTIATTVTSKRAAKKARKEANKDAAQARKAEVFAETEGEGIGNLANISLEVDDELDPTEINKRAGKSSTVSI